MTSLTPIIVGRSNLPKFKLSTKKYIFWPMLAKKDSRHSLKDRFIEEEEEEADVEDNSD